MPSATWGWMPYLTPRKIANVLVNLAECRLARPQPQSIPPFIKIEATPLCHLTCSGCVHRSKAYKKTLSRTMQLSGETVSRIIDPIARDLIRVSLSYSGEPLLNRDLPEIVAHIHGRGIYTSFASNLSIPLSDAQAESFVALRHPGIQRGFHSSASPVSTH